MELALSAVAALAVLWFFQWTVSANSGFANWGDLDYYQLLVRGWKKGQLSLDKAPSPELLALPDPYDPHANGPYKLGDASLYRGRYYLYFGAAPALTLMLPYSLLTGREMTIGAGVFVFCSVAFLAMSALWLFVRWRYFPRSRIAMAPLGVVAIGMGTHLLALLQRPMIWELPISAGVAFTTLAVAGAVWAIHGRRPVLAMALAGLALGLAVGSRPTCLFASVLLLPPLWLAWRAKNPARDFRWMALAAGGTLGLCGLAIMAHNHARFDSPLEWGQNYQLSGAYEGKLTHFSIRFSLRNFCTYLFQPLRWTSEFPFALSEGIEIDHIPGYFGTEEVSGLAVTFPYYWFLLGVPLVLWRRETQERRTFTATLTCILGYALPVMALVMCYFSTTTRYETDFAVVLGALALVGLLGLERWSQQFRLRVRATIAGLGALLIVVTAGVGVLASFDYHGRSMHFTAPLRWQALEQSTHEFLAEVGRRLGQVPGPAVLKVRFASQPTGTVETFWRSTDSHAAERIVVEHIGERLIRFGFARGGESPVYGRPLRWETNHTHTVSVQLPSLYPRRATTWWTGVQRRVEFQQRSCVAVWFSGGRALDRIVVPLGDDFRPGGGVAPEFSGEIRRATTRRFRIDEVPSGLAEYHAPRGGVLRIPMRLPDGLHEKGEPIFAAGAHYRSSILFAEATEGSRVKFTFENYGQPRVSSEAFVPRPEGHLVELEMASFRPEAYGVEATGDVVVRLDGREILRTTQVAYPFPWGEEQIGYNPFGTTCSSYFRGWIHDARWVRASAGALSRAPGRDG